MDLSREEELMKCIMQVSDRIAALSPEDPNLPYVKACCCAVQICFFISVGMVCWLHFIFICYAQTVVYACRKNLLGKAHVFSSDYRIFCTKKNYTVLFIAMFAFQWLRIFFRCKVQKHAWDSCNFLCKQWNPHMMIFLISAPNLTGWAKKRLLH